MAQAQRALSYMREPPVLPGNPGLYQWLYELWFKSNDLIGLAITDSVASDDDAFNITIITASYTATSLTDQIICNSASAITVSLPSAIGAGKRINIKNINTGAVTVDADSTDTIDDELTQTVSQWSDMQIVDYDTGKWSII